MIDVCSISKAFKKDPVLKDITFNVSKGTTACIIGQNGSGKSTLFSIMANQIKPDHGTVTLGTNQDIRKAVGFVPQQDYLFYDLKVKENILFWAAAANLKISSAEVKKYIELFNISSFMNKKIAELSGGMKRRVSLCAALLHNPDILLLDEPFSGLDIIHKQEITSYLNKLRESGKTILYSTHNADEIYLMAQELYVIYDGKIYKVAFTNSLDNINSTVTKFLKGEFNDDK